jgi:magnesium chelatase subunit D
VSVASRSGGRPVGARRGLPRDGARLDLLATLRAAVPWQRLRGEARAQAGLPAPSTRLLLRRDDLHVRRLRRPQPTTTVFVVDASGSQALHRLAEAKGAVELLLADCYVRRDQVALIAFRGVGAETLLAPTRSLVRARRALSALPGGGGTPLSQGIAMATELALRLQAGQAGRAQLVFLTDARANIDHGGQPGREQAMQDALGAARQLAQTGVRSLLIDTSPRPQPPGRALAQAMAGHYLALPLGQARALSAAVQSLG